MIRRIRLAALALGLLAAQPAWAEADLFSRDTVSGLIDLRAAVADGEEGWPERSYGKLRYGGSGEGARGHADIAEAHLVWRPRLSWSWSATVDFTYQPDQDHGVDLGEVIVAYKSAPGPTRYAARIGLMYPPVSLEHSGAAWTVTDSITPSAINSWIGEEVKVIGAEGTVRRAFGDHELAATAAVFGYDDTSGTLLTIRGWALHDLKATAWGDFPLPPMSPFMRTKQAADSKSLDEIDRRVGYYGRLEWRPPGPVSLEAFYYDNAGNRTGVEHKQWAWETRFLNLGATWQLDERTRIVAQAMNGETLMGFRMPGGYWIDAGFSSGYLLASRTFGDSAITGRLDVFAIRDRTYKAIDDNAEEGWAAMLAWRRPLSDHATFLLEAIHVSSDRPGRVYMGVGPEQAQSAVQSSLRLAF